MLKGVYLAAGYADLNIPGILYNDLFIKRDLPGDMLSIDLSDFDFLIASPPCNYYSRCNYRRDISNYSLSTKHLLPCVIDKFISTGKPFIVENVRNFPLFSSLGLFDKNCLVYFYGRHTYWTNIFINFDNIPQVYDFRTIKGYGTVRLHSSTQGGSNVNLVFKHFVKLVNELSRK